MKRRATNLPATIVVVDPDRLASLDAEPGDKADRWISSLVYVSLGVAAGDGTVAGCLLVAAVGSFAELSTTPVDTLDGAIAALRCWRDDLEEERRANAHHRIADGIGRLDADKQPPLSAEESVITSARDSRTDPTRKR